MNTIDRIRRQVLKYNLWWFHSSFLECEWRFLALHLWMGLKHIRCTMNWRDLPILLLWWTLWFFAKKFCKENDNLFCFLNGKSAVVINIMFHFSLMNSESAKSNLQSFHHLWERRTWGWMKTKTRKNSDVISGNILNLF